MHAGVSDPRRTPNPPRGGVREDSHPHPRPPQPRCDARDLRRATSDAPLTPRYARPRGRSHNTVPVHTIHVTSALTRSPHLEGSASSHRPRGATRGQEGDARVGSPPPLPTQTGYRRGTAPKPAVVLLTSTSTQYNHRTASLPEVLPQYILHSVQSSQQPLRLRAGGWATNERLLRPRLRNRGAPAPRGAGADRARPPGSLPHSVARHARRSDPDATAKGANAARDETPHACRSLRPAPNPELPERGRSGGLTPPPRPPAAALRRARPPPSDVGRAPPAEEMPG